MRLTLYFSFSLITLFFMITAKADCNDAKKKCRNECTTQVKVQGNGKTITLLGYQTDFQSHCEDACVEGYSDCENTDGAAEEKCSVFKTKCQKGCPNSVYVYTNFNGAKPGYSSHSDVETRCRDACNMGYRKCE